MIAVALALGLAAAQPRLGVVDTTAAGAPDVAAALAAAAVELGRFDVQSAAAVDKAVAEARHVGAACAFDEGPDCWARLGVLSELDRIVVLRVKDKRIDLLLVDVPARTAARTSTTLGDDPRRSADDALAALLSGHAAAPPQAPHGGLFYTGVYSAAAGAVVVAGCGGGALGVSSQMASLLVQARDRGKPLGDDYRTLDVAFVALSVCTGVAAVAAAGGGVLAAVAE